MWQCSLCEASAAGTAVKRSKKRRDLCEWCVADLHARGLDWCPRGKHKAVEMTYNRNMCLDCRRVASRRFSRTEAAKIKAKARRATYDPQMVRDRQRRYYYQSIEHKRALQRKYYWRDRAKFAARAARWRAANTARHRAITAAYYWTHRAERLASHRQNYIRRKLAILRGER